MLRYDSRCHRLRDPRSCVSDVARTLNREFRTKNFFVYQHLEAGSFVVAFWLNDQKTRMQEVELVKPSAAGILNWDLGAMMRRWRGLYSTPEALIRHLRSQASFERHSEEDEEGELADMKRHICGDKVAVSMAGAS